MSTAKLPTRSRPDDGRFRGGRLRLVEGVCHPNPPDPPGAPLEARGRALPGGVARARVDAMAALGRAEGGALGVSRRACRNRSGVVGFHSVERARAAASYDAARAGGGRRHGRARRRDGRALGPPTAPHARRSKLSPDVRRELARLRRDDPLGALDDDAIP